MKYKYIVLRIVNSYFIDTVGAFDSQEEAVHVVDTQLNTEPVPQEWIPQGVKNARQIIWKVIKLDISSPQKVTKNLDQKLLPCEHPSDDDIIN